MRRSDLSANSARRRAAIRIIEQNEPLLRNQRIEEDDAEDLLSYLPRGQILNQDERNGAEPDDDFDFNCDSDEADDYLNTEDLQ